MHGASVGNGHVGRLLGGGEGREGGLSGLSCR